VDPLLAHQRAQDAFAGVLANVSPDHLGAPTPCTEWTAKDLIEHVIGGNEYVGKWADNPIEPPPRPDNIADAHRTAATAAHEIFAGLHKRYWREGIYGETSDEALMVASGPRFPARRIGPKFAPNSLANSW